MEENHKSQVISFRVSDQNVLGFYKNNRDLCTEALKSKLWDLASDTAPPSLEKTTDDGPSVSQEPINTGEVDASSISEIRGSIVRFVAEIDTLLRSEDFDSRLDLLGDSVEKIMNSCSEMESKIAGKEYIDTQLNQRFSSLRIQVFVAAIIVLAVAIMAVWL